MRIYALACVASKEWMHAASSRGVNPSPSFLYIRIRVNAHMHSRVWLQKTLTFTRFKRFHSLAVMHTSRIHTLAVMKIAREAAAKLDKVCAARYAHMHAHIHAHAYEEGGLESSQGRYPRPGWEISFYVYATV